VFAQTVNFLTINNKNVNDAQVNVEHVPIKELVPNVLVEVKKNLIVTLEAKA